MRILVIDDDPNLIDLVRRYLEPDGHIVSGTQDAQDGLDMILNWRPDLVLLDIVMPKMDGRRLCERARRISQVPIVFLTALGSELDVVSALGAGADEYLVKPPRAHELRARIRALLRQSQACSNIQNFYDDGYLVVDIPARHVQKQGSRVDLTPLGYRLLFYLVARRGHLVPHQELLEALWPTAQNRSTATLHLYIRYLRSNLEPEPGAPRYFLNRFGEGYWFEPHDTDVP